MKDRNINIVNPKENCGFTDKRKTRLPEFSQLLLADLFYSTSKHKS